LTRFSANLPRFLLKICRFFPARTCRALSVWVSLRFRSEPMVPLSLFFSANSFYLRTVVDPPCALCPFLCSCLKVPRDLVFLQYAVSLLPFSFHDIPPPPESFSDLAFPDFSFPVSFSFLKRKEISLFSRGFQTQRTRSRARTFPFSQQGPLSARSFT